MISFLILQNIIIIFYLNARKKMIKNIWQYKMNIKIWRSIDPLFYLLKRMISPFPHTKLSYQYLWRYPQQWLTNLMEAHFDIVWRSWCASAATSIGTWRIIWFRWMCCLQWVRGWWRFPISGLTVRHRLFAPVMLGFVTLTVSMTEMLGCS